MAGESIVKRFNSPSDQRVTLIRSQWVDWDSLRETVKEKWKEVELYRYSTDTTEILGETAFDHTTHLPVVATIAEDLEAIVIQTVMPHDDWFAFKPFDRASITKEVREAVAAYLKNRHSLYGLKGVVRKLVTDLVNKGNCFVNVAFVNEQKERNGRKKGYIGPKAFRISPYDIVFNPTAPTFEDSPKIIREIISMPELLRRAKRWGMDESAVKEIVELRRDSGSPSTPTGYQDKNAQYVPAGFGDIQSYLQSGNVELLWFYGDMYDPETGDVEESRMIVVADNVVLLDTEIDTWNGKPYIYKAGWEDRTDNLWSMGPLERIVGINYQIDHRENAKSDALDKMIFPDQLRAGDVEEVYDETTGQTIYISPNADGVVRDISPDTSFLSFDLHIDRLERFSRLAARLPSDLVGFRSAGEKTLGEVTSLLEGAMRGFLHKIEGFEIDLLQPMLQAELVLASENQFETIQVPAVRSEAGITPFFEVNADKLKVEGALVPKGARRFARSLQILENLTRLNAAGLLQLTAPHISSKNLTAMIEDLAELGEYEIFGENEALIEQAEQAQLANQLQAQVAGAATQPTLEEELIAAELEGGIPEDVPAEGVEEDGAA
jgi:hypothetical protein